jgi:hypothetical protein
LPAACRQQFREANHIRKIVSARRPKPTGWQPVLPNPKTHQKKMPDGISAIRHFVDTSNYQQRLNCALSVVSLSLDFFRYRGLNGMSEFRRTPG